MANRPDATKGQSDKAVLARASKRLKYVAEADRENRQRQKEDTEFVYVSGKSWPDDTRKKRKAAGDPCMEFPQLGQFVAQVVNDQRQGRPGVRVHAAGGDASDEVAEILQGLIRGIEYDSQAEAVFDGGYQASVVGGRGYWRIVTEYESAGSFNQKLVIKRIADPLSVYLDPDFQDADGGDRMYGFVVESVPLDEFEARYPDAKPVSVDVDGLWRPDEEHVLVADYYERVASKRKLVALSDGMTGYQDEMPELPPEVQVVSEREITEYRVEWYTIAGGEQVLKKHEWGTRKGVRPASIIPIVCTMGDEIVVDGERMYRGLITPARDAQTLFDFGMTQQAIHLALTPRTPYIAAVGATAGFEPLWNNANTSNFAMLPWHPFDEAGRPMPKPERQQGTTPDTGWLNWTQQMTGLIRSTIGMYENSLGMKGQEVSGKAITARERQGDNATFHFQDNLSRAIGLTGRIAVECIPHYYDTERIVYTIAPDDTRKAVTINEQTIDPRTGALQAIAESNVTVGEYAVTVEAGPSYATKRQESADLMMGMVQAYPPLMQSAGDLVMKAQDVPDADLFAERLKLTLPPVILQAIAAKEQEENGAKPPDPAMMAQLQQMQQQMQQAEMMMQELQAENQQLKAGAQEKQAAAQIGAQTDMSKAELDAQVELQKAELDAQTTLQKAEIERQTKLQIAGMQVASSNEQSMRSEEQAMRQGGQQKPDAGSAELVKALLAERELVRDPVTGKAIGSRVKQGAN